MLTCIEKLESVQGTIYLIAAYSYLVLKIFCYSQNFHIIIVNLK